MALGGLGAPDGFHDIFPTQEFVSVVQISRPYLSGLLTPQVIAAQDTANPLFRLTPERGIQLPTGQLCR